MTRSSFVHRATGLIALGLGLVTAPALAQEPDAPAGDKALESAPAEEEETPETVPAPSPSPKAGAPGVSARAVGATDAALPVEPGAPGAPTEMAPGAARCSADTHQGYHPEYTDRSCYAHKAELGKSVFLYGGLELDVGYAHYEFRDYPATPSANFEDIRGRFVLGAMLAHDFGNSGWFVAATGQLVAWLRDVPGDRYQVNVDDVYGQVGKHGLIDFQIGRFMTWRVYHKGLGFDLYTLEDRGVPVDPNGTLFGTHTYEVSYIFYRRNPEADATLVQDEDAGRAAINFYPAKILGFQLAAPWGLAEFGTYNTLGARLAGDLHMRIGPVLLRASAGGEYRKQEKARRELGFNPASGEYDIECLDCGVQVNKGGGGSMIVKVSIVEAGGGYAKGFDMRHEPTAGTDDPAHSKRAIALTGERTAYGGYLQVDPGILAFKRSLILGVGYQHAEQLLENEFFQEHVIGAAYIAFPLGFNDAILKLVLSRGDLDQYIPRGDEYTRYHNSMQVGRLRFTFPF